MFPKRSKFIKPQENIGGAHNLQKKLCSLCDHEAEEPSTHKKKKASDGRVQTCAAQFARLTASRKKRVNKCKHICSSSGLQGSAGLRSTKQLQHQLLCLRYRELWKVEQCLLTLHNHFQRSPCVCLCYSLHQDASSISHLKAKEESHPCSATFFLRRSTREAEDTFNAFHTLCYSPLSRETRARLILRFTST